MTELDKNLLDRAEKVEKRPDGVYVTLRADSVSADELNEMIMREVRKLQAEKGS